MSAVEGVPPRAGSTLASVRPRDDRDRLVHAARQFESLLIAQLLKSMRETGSAGWLGTGDDKADAHLMELAEEQLATSLAEHGGLGLAKLVVAGLDQAKAQAAAHPIGAVPRGTAQKLQP